MCSRDFIRLNTYSGYVLTVRFTHTTALFVGCVDSTRYYAETEQLVDLFYRFGFVCSRDFGQYKYNLSALSFLIYSISTISEYIRIHPPSILTSSLSPV
jgi:hypothetical protein